MSSNLFSYNVSMTASDGFTEAVTFSVTSSTGDTNPIDIWYSLDPSIVQIQERNDERIISNGAGFYLTSDDVAWCTQCTVYFYVEITIPGRYYVTATAGARNPVVNTGQTVDKFVNKV